MKGKSLKGWLWWRKVCGREAGGLHPGAKKVT